MKRLGLVQRFAIISLIVVVVMSLALGLAVTFVVEEVVLHRTAQATNIVANALIADAVDSSGLASGLDPDQWARMDEIVDVIQTGSGTIGAPSEFISNELQEAFDRADLIIAKGQGNFETLDELDHDIFFILKAKCPVVATEMGVGLYDVGLLCNRKRLGR